MSATAAEIGYGLLLKMRTSTGPDVYTTLGKQRDVTPPGFSVDMVDATHNESPGTIEEVIAGLIRTSDISFQIEYNPVSATTALIEGAARVLKTFRTVWPDGRYVTLSGYVTEFAPEAPTEDKQVASVTIKRTGAYVVTNATLPSNTVLPAISGVLSVGSVLTAYEGVWADEPTSFTYVWKKGGVVKAGETGKTYTVVSGDSPAGSITVSVTGVNSAGSATATSAPVVIP